MPDYSLNIRNKEYPAGNPDATNTLIEYGDYECPYSRLGYRFVQKILKKNNNLTFLFRHFPLTKKHPNAQISAEAALCAGDQGKFWEMHDLLFDNNRNLDREKLDEFAMMLDLDMRKFTVDLETNVFKNWVQLDYRSGIKNGVNDTPTFFLNGKKYLGELNLNTFQNFIDNGL